MTQRNVEILIGRLATDEELRSRFERDPGTTLRELREEGLVFSALETAALQSLEPRAFEHLASTIDPHLQKASLK
jgi:hypothetical protein